MTGIVKAAAVQISPVLYSRQRTVDKVVEKIRELGEQGVLADPRRDARQ
jgi:nitrilase